MFDNFSDFMFWRLFLTQDFMDDLSSYSLPISTFALILRGFSLRMVHKLTLVFSLHWECRWTNTYSFNLFADCKLLINFANFWHKKHEQSITDFQDHHCHCNDDDDDVHHNHYDHHQDKDLKPPFMHHDCQTDGIRNWNRSDTSKIMTPWQKMNKVV